MMKIVHFLLLLTIYIPYFSQANSVSVLPVNTGWVSSLFQANLLVQITFIILLGMSIVSWGIIFTKRKMFKQTKIHNDPFKDIFQQASNLQSIYDISQHHPKSSLATIFRNGYTELKKLSTSKLAESDVSAEGLLSGIDNLERTLEKSISNELAVMEDKLQFLATTGSVSPFIGLFGTVFGIMDAFQKIGQSGSASLAVVAPGISEALTATGLGLFVAIPAAIFYNYYLNEIRKTELLFSNFTTDFLNIAKRNFFKNS